MDDFFNLRLIINDMVFYLIKNILNNQIVYIKKYKNEISLIKKDLNIIINKTYDNDFTKTVSPVILETELFNLNDWITDFDNIIKKVLSFLYNVSSIKPDSDKYEIKSLIYKDIKNLDLTDINKELRLKERTQLDENRGKKRKSVFLYNEFIDYIKDFRTDISNIETNIDFLLFNLNIFVDNINNIKKVISELREYDMIQSSELKALEKTTVKINLITKNNLYILNRNITRNIANTKFIINVYKEDIN